MKNRGLYAMFGVIVAPNPPEWLFHEPYNVPKIETPYHGGSSFPYYIDSTFKAEFKRMISAVAQYIQSYQADMPTRFIAVQAPVGASGDPHPYKNEAGDTARDAGGSFCPPPDQSQKYCISKTEWIDYQKEIFSYYTEKYKNSGIFVLFNPSADLEFQRWMVNNLSPFWVKLGPIADRYQINDEAESWGTRWIEEFKLLPSRGEMDLTDEGWFKEDPIGNMYWSQLWALHNGLDMHNQLVRDVKESKFHFAFEFFSKYAGYTSPEKSNGAWIALRDGLDSADTKRFPEKIYGELKEGRNKERYLNIAKAFSAQGAKQSDPDAGKKTSWNALNDVGYKIHPGNYEMWIHQIEPETSQGYWRQGPKEQGFGRFARGFGQIKKMFFDINDRFFLNKPLAGAYPIKIRVVYLDSGNGKWALDYDALSGQKTIEVQKQNSKRWKEFTIEITDAYFGNRLEKGADLILKNIDSDQDIFHMIEIQR